MLRTLIRFIKTYFLWELLRGLALTGSRLFRRKFTVQYPDEKTPKSPRFRGCMRFDGILTERNAALLANFAKRFARL